MSHRPLHRPLAYFTSSFATVLGLVLIWRGIWYVLDGFDRMFLGGSHLLTAIGGIVVGLLILYLPDRDLEELRKL
jgi:membrane-associated phospholipid phosphatase